MQASAGEAVEEMKPPTFFILSLLLAVLALSAQLWSMGFEGRAVHMRVRAHMGPPAERAQGLTDAKEYLRQAPYFRYVGAALAVAAVVLIAVSSRRREPVSRAILVGLIVGYLVLQFVAI